MFIEIISQDGFVSDTFNAKFFSTQAHTGLALVGCLKGPLRLFLDKASLCCTGWSQPTGITEQTWTTWLNLITFFT